MSINWNTSLADEGHRKPYGLKFNHLSFMFLKTIGSVGLSIIRHANNCHSNLLELANQQCFWT